MAVSATGHGHTGSASKLCFGYAAVLPLLLPLPLPLLPFPGIALAKMAIAEMVRGECEEVVLEAEVTNMGALALYRRLGFIRDKRLHR